MVESIEGDRVSVSSLHFNARVPRSLCVHTSFDFAIHIVDDDLCLNRELSPTDLGDATRDSFVQEMKYRVCRLRS